MFHLDIESRSPNSVSVKTLRAYSGLPMKPRHETLALAERREIGQPHILEGKRPRMTAFASAWLANARPARPSGPTPPGGQHHLRFSRVIPEIPSKKSSFIIIPTEPANGKSRTSSCSTFPFENRSTLRAWRICSPSHLPAEIPGNLRGCHLGDGWPLADKPPTEKQTQPSPCL
jgi:hypothetical protein